MPDRARVTPVNPPGVSSPTAPYSHALLVETRRLLLVSGQGPVDAAGNVVGRDDPEAQIRQVFANIQALVEAAGGSLADVVEITCYLRKMEYRTTVTKVRQEILRPPYPTSTVVEIASLSFDDWLVEISAIAAL